MRVVPRMIAHGASTVSFIAGVLAGFSRKMKFESDAVGKFKLNFNL